MRNVFYILIGALMLACAPNQREKESPSSPSTSEASQSKESKIKKSLVVLDTFGIIKRNKEFGKYPCVSAYDLVNNDLDMIPPSELKLIRNEIYARYGYVFKTKDLRNHFAKQNWYVPLFDNVDSLLTPRELKNIELIKKHEKINNPISQKELFDYFIEYIHKTDADSIPRMVAYKYGEKPFSENWFLSGASRQVFKTAKEYRFLIYYVNHGCNECLDEYELRKFDLEGNELENWDLGKNLSIIEMKSDRHLYCYGIAYPYTQEINPEDIDTIRLNIKLTKDENLVFEDAH